MCQIERGNVYLRNCENLSSYVVKSKQVSTTQFLIIALPAYVIDFCFTRIFSNSSSFLTLVSFIVKVIFRILEQFHYNCKQDRNISWNLTKNSTLYSKIHIHNTSDKTVCKKVLSHTGANCFKRLLSRHTSFSKKYSFTI